MQKIKVKCGRSLHFGGPEEMVYKAGDVLTVTDELANDLISRGTCEMAESGRAAVTENINRKYQRRQERNK